MPLIRSDRTMQIGGDNQDRHVCVNKARFPHEVDTVQLAGHLHIRQKNIDPLTAGQEPHGLVGIPCFHDVKASVAQHFRQEFAGSGPHHQRAKSVRLSFSSVASHQS